MLGMRRFSQMSMNVRRVMTALLLLTVAYPVWANEAAGDPAPSQSSAATTKDLQILRPFVFGGLALGGATYDVFAGEVRTGVEVETKSLVFVTDFGLPSGFFLQRPTAMCFCVDESINRYHPISGSTNHEDFLNFRVIWHS